MTSSKKKFQTFFEKAFPQDFLYDSVQSARCQDHKHGELQAKILYEESCRRHRQEVLFRHHPRRQVNCWQFWRKATNCKLVQASRCIHLASTVWGGQAFVDGGPRRDRAYVCNASFIKILVLSGMHYNCPNNLFAGMLTLLAGSPATPTKLSWTSPASALCKIAWLALKTEGWRTRACTVLLGWEARWRRSKPEIAIFQSWCSVNYVFTILRWQSCWQWDLTGGKRLN